MISHSCFFHYTGYIPRQSLELVICNLGLLSPVSLIHSKLCPWLSVSSRTNLFVQFLSLCLTLLLGPFLLWHVLGNSRAGVRLVSRKLLRTLRLSCLAGGVRLGVTVNLAGLLIILWLVKLSLWGCVSHTWAAGYVVSGMLVLVFIMFDRRT